MALIDKLRSLAADGVFVRQKNDDVKVLEEAIDLLRSSTCYCLQKKLVPALGLETGTPLASAVVSSMFLEPPTEAREMFFYEKNLSLICQQALSAHKQEGIAGPSGCASYLYAAKLLHATMTRQAAAGSGERPVVAEALKNQAADLNIVIPGSAEICGSEDSNNLIRAIYGFAKAFYYTNTWSGNIASAELPLPSIQYDEAAA